MALDPAPAPPPTEGQVESVFKPTSSALLVQLLIGLFSSAANMKTFILSYREMEAVAGTLPGDNVSAEQMAFDLVINLRARNLITWEFFSELLRIRPFHSVKIGQVAKEWGFNLPEKAFPPKPSSRARRFIIGTCVVLIATIMLLSFRKVAHHFGGQKSNSAIPLGTEELDPMVLTVVSSQSGESWVVSASKHRTAESTARDIFKSIRLGGDSGLETIFRADDFRLCQNSKCYAHEKIGDVISSEIPVQIERKLMGTYMLIDLSRSTPPRGVLPEEKTPLQRVREEERCEKYRSDAIQKRKTGKTGEFLRMSDGSCWKDHPDILEWKVQAVGEVGNFSQCVALGEHSSNPAISKMVENCKNRQRPLPASYR